MNEGITPGVEGVAVFASCSKDCGESCGTLRADTFIVHGLGPTSSVTFQIYLRRDKIGKGVSS